MFDKGKAYPSNRGTNSAQNLAKFVQNYTEDCQMCGQRIRPAASELSLYYEYAKREVSNHDYYIDGYNYLQGHLNNTWFHDEVMAPYFGPKVGRKTIGERLLLWIIVPVVLNALFFLWILTRCLCNCCSEKKSTDSSAEAKPKPSGVASAEAEKK